MLTKLRSLSTSLRGRLFIAFVLLILLTVLLTGLLAAQLTNRRFALLVTEENKTRALAVAPLLEVSYLLHGDWEQVDKLWRKESALTAQTAVSATVNSHWYGIGDWSPIIAPALAMSPEFLAAESNANDSMADVIENYGRALDVIVGEIIAAEKQAIDAAIISGTVAITVAEKYQKQMTEEQVRASLLSQNYAIGINWNDITAMQLGLTKTALQEAMRRQTVAELAQMRGVDLKQIAQAIIHQEIDKLRSGPPSNEGDAIWNLYSSLSWLEQYLGQPVTTSHSETVVAATEWTGLLSIFLQAGDRLLLVDPAGVVQYDSAGGSQQDRPLGDEVVAKGVPLHRWPTDTQIGMLAITDAPDYYSIHQQTFLQNVTYSLLFSGALAVLLALAVAYLLARQIIAPVSALTSAAQQIADGFTDARLPVTTQNELGRMSITFNQMAAALATQRALRQRLVNDLSHELNTPLSVIQLEMQALRDGLQTPGQAFEQVQGEIELLRNLVRDLSNLETTDNGHFPLQCEPVDLLALAQRAIKRWQAKAESKGVTLTLAAPVDLLPITEADPARLTQVLGNLLDNALRHTEAGGAITVACQVTTLAALTLPSTYRPVTALSVPGLAMTVSDTGCGIPAADLPHLFERFYRVDSSRNRRSGGRGLGLAIVRQIIVAHGGHVWTHSVDGQGSRFGFWLPITEIE